MERFFQDCRTIQRFRSGPLGAHLQQLAEELAEQGFARRSVREQLRTADHFGRWLKKCRKPLRDVTSDHASRYVVCHGKVKRGDARALKRILEILERQGLIAAPKEPSPKTQAQSVIDEFVEYLQRERALAPRTIEYYRSFVIGFLVHRFGQGPVNLSSIQAGDVFAFVRHEVSRMSSESAKNVTTALRSFLNCARLRGAIDLDLAGAVPTVASWSLSGIPKRLSRDEVKRILAGCDRRTAIGRRDYAILLLLARLGLRASEIASLNLEDIGWAAGTLSVRGKGGKLCKLPLPQDVGQAIASYLRRDRPRVATRRVFLRVKAPIVGFMRPSAVGLVVKYALARAGVQSHSKGAHQIRHTLATEMLRSGASLAEIGEVLRHQDPHRTTAIYAKVDFAALRPLAPPWLGGVQ